MFLEFLNSLYEKLCDFSLKKVIRQFYAISSSCNSADFADYETDKNLKG